MQSVYSTAPADWTISWPCAISKRSWIDNIAVSGQDFFFFFFVFLLFSNSWIHFIYSYLFMLKLKLNFFISFLLFLDAVVSKPLRPLFGIQDDHWGGGFLGCVHLLMKKKIIIAISIYVNCVNLFGHFVFSFFILLYFFSFFVFRFLILFLTIFFFFFFFLLLALLLISNINLIKGFHPVAKNKDRRFA